MPSVGIVTIVWCPVRNVPLPVIIVVGVVTIMAMKVVAISAIII
jgi:hypothetical protein